MARIFIVKGWVMSERYTMELLFIHKSKEEVKEALEEHKKSDDFDLTAEELLRCGEPYSVTIKDRMYSVFNLTEDRYVIGHGFASTKDFTSSLFVEEDEDEEFYNILRNELSLSNKNKASWYICQIQSVSDDVSEDEGVGKDKD